MRRCVLKFVAGNLRIAAKPVWPIRYEILIFGINIGIGAADRRAVAKLVRALKLEPVDPRPTGVHSDDHFGEGGIAGYGRLDHLVIPIDVIAIDTDQTATPIDAGAQTKLVIPDLFLADDLILRQHAGIGVETARLVALGNHGVKQRGVVQLVIHGHARQKRLERVVKQHIAKRCAGRAFDACDLVPGVAPFQRHRQLFGQVIFHGSEHRVVRHIGGVAWAGEGEGQVGIRPGRVRSKCRQAASGSGRFADL